MPPTNRPGDAVAPGSESRRMYLTLPAAASAFFDMNTRPAPVATQSVPVSLGVRAIEATKRPRRSAPYTGGARGLTESVRSVALAGPIWTKSPQAVLAPEVVNSGQLASRNAWLPAQSCVRQTLFEPWKIVPARAGFGSGMMGA